MRTCPRTDERIIRHAHMACGIGVGARGFNLAVPRVGTIRGRFECAGGIDVDAGAIRNFERMTGVKGTVMDLFALDQYMAFHGKQPPVGWREATPDDVRAAYGDHVDVAFASMPCKGFSGLLSATQSKTDKYQALNGLTLRGIWLLLEAYKDDPIPIVLFENVPRIQTRGRWLLDQIIAIFRSYGYSVNEDTHDCGVIGGLAQSRKRFLLIARHSSKVPPFVYQPQHHRLRGVGEVIGKLPLPGDPVAGPMHRVPALQWKTWVRLAFVPAGNDWRALNDYVVADGVLRDFGIVPEQPMRDNSLGVCGWGETAPVVTSQRAPGQGRFSVADPRVGADWNADVLGVRDWAEPSGTVAGRSSPSNGVYSVADPRGPIVQDAEGRARAHGKYPVDNWEAPAKAVIGGRDNGAYAVADPRVDGLHHGSLGVKDWNGPGAVVTGKSRPHNGAHSVADPRVDGHPRSVQLGVRRMEDPAPCIKGDMSVGTGPYAIADPRMDGRPRFNNVFRIVPFDATSPAVAGPGGPAGGLAVADPRPENKENYASTKYKVTRFDQESRAVIGASTTGDGAFAVADPRPQWGGDRHRNIMRVTGYDEPAGTIPANPHSVTGGHPCVADPRRVMPVPDPRPVCLNAEGREGYATQGHYGIVGWGEHSGAVPGFAKNNNGPWSVADPREAVLDVEPVALPAPEERLVCRIIAADDSWHRPFTTLDLAALQSLFDPEEAYYCEDGVWRARASFDLDASSDVAKREWIGNAVPGASATGMAETIGETLILASIGEKFQLSTRQIWVKPLALALAVDNDQVAFRMDGAT